jgi:serine/threonine protein kinase
MSQLGQLAPGSKCDRYEIVRLIGAGGMGEVYQALHGFTKKPVALKVLKIKHAGKADLVEKMRAEAMVLCRIKHDNLIEVYDAGIAEVTVAGDSAPRAMIWMAMELLDGESLRERLIREGAVRMGLALDWAAQVADGVQAAHDAQVIHRDLKPENIFLTKKGDIRVLDFGTAKFEGFGLPETKQAERVGTIPYMAPEHLGGEKVDARSDVFALGFIVYEMLAGRHPFANADGSFPPLDQLMGMQLAGEPASLEGFVGPAIWQVVQRACQGDPSQRFASMSELARVLRAVRTELTGTSASGPLRISGTSASVSGGYPATAALPSASPSATAVGASNVTPPPVGITPAPIPHTGVGRGALTGMAIAAASLSAILVVLVSGGAETAESAVSPAAAGAVETSDERGETQEGVFIERASEPPEQQSGQPSASASASAAPKVTVPRPRVPRPARPKPKDKGEIF